MRDAKGPSKTTRPWPTPVVAIITSAAPADPVAKTPWIDTASAAVEPTAEESSEANDKPFCDVEWTKQN